MKAALFVLFCVASLYGCATPSQMAADAEVRRLCAIDGGINVYEKVILPTGEYTYYAKQNWILPKAGSLKADDKYFIELEESSSRQGSLVVTRSVTRVLRRNDNKVLGVSIRYGRGGGDIPGPWHPSSFMCPEISKDSPGLELSIFIKEREE